MKYLSLIVVVFAMNSCNTFIGIGRDTRHGYEWTKEKIQGTGGNGGGNDYDAPVY